MSPWSPNSPHGSSSGKAHPNETSSATAALNVIGFYDGCSNGALSQALGLSHTAADRLVDKAGASKWS
jgi:hypothetical protein